MHTRTPPERRSVGIFSLSPFTLFVFLSTGMTFRQAEFLEQIRAAESEQMQSFTQKMSLVFPGSSSALTGCWAALRNADGPGWKVKGVQ